MDRRSLWIILPLMLVTTVGCQREPTPEAAAVELPVVPVSLPVQREVTDYVDFTGRTDAVQSVDIRPRVTGYLMRMPYREGSEVKVGDLLFEIDPRPYIAQLEQARGQVALNEASLKLAQTTYERDRAIATSTPGGVSQQQLDEDRAAVEEARSRVRASQASMAVYQLNLSFTNVTSPIDGQISRYYLTAGNLVNQDQTLLTTIVSLDPMYVYFDMDEPTLLRIRTAIADGRITRPANGEFPVLMALQGEEGYRHQGTINFINNQVNSTTGSISVRGVFPNPRPGLDRFAVTALGLACPGLAPATVARSAAACGVASLGESALTADRLLSPGMFVRVRFPLGQPHDSLLLIDRAISSDQGLKYVYVLDKNNKAQYRRVTTGALQEDGLRVITQGLKPEDRVVVGALQQVRPQAEVKPEAVTMPTIGLPASAATETSPATPPLRTAGRSAKGDRGRGR